MRSGIALIIDMHSHANGHVYSRKTKESIPGMSYSGWIDRFQKPHHPFLSPEQVDEYYSNLNPSRYIEEMDEAGIDKAVLLILPHQLSDKQVYEMYVKKNPNRLIGFSGPRPLDDNGRFNEHALTQLEKAVKDYGFKGLKLIPTYMHYSPNDRRIYPLYQKAVELDIPVVFHQAATPVVSAKLSYARPLLLEDVADDFPDLRIIAAHMGYPWTEELLALMQKRHNIFTDIAHLCIQGLMLVWYLVMAKQYHLLDKVLFGTDTTCRPPKKYVEWLRITLNQQLKRMGWSTLSEEEIDGILGKNASNLLRLRL